jgi:large subunit ribosomal protein L22
MAEAKAISRYVRMSPRKIRAVLDIIRGKKVENAFSILKFTNRRAATVVTKILKSAVDNAIKDKKLNEDMLFVKGAFADIGPTMKRYMPRAMGRAASIHKRTSHITIILGEKQWGKK